MIRDTTSATYGIPIAQRNPAPMIARGKFVTTHKRNPTANLRHVRRPRRRVKYRSGPTMTITTAPCQAPATPSMRGVVAVSILG